MANIKYPPLEEPCKSAIKEGKCLGCQALEELTFRGNKNCKEIKNENRSFGDKIQNRI